MSILTASVKEKVLAGVIIAGILAMGAFLGRTVLGSLDPTSDVARVEQAVEENQQNIEILDERIQNVKETLVGVEVRLTAVERSLDNVNENLNSMIRWFGVKQ